MAQICPACQASNPDSATACSNCQAPLPGPAPPPSPPTTSTPAGIPSAARRSPASGAIAEAARRRAAQQKAAAEAAAAVAAGRPAPTSRTSSGGPAARAPVRGPVRGLTAPLNQALDRAGLQRFSTGRYLAIWAGFLVILLLTIGALVAIGASNARQPAPVIPPGTVLTGTVVTVDTTKGVFKITLNADDPSVKGTIKNFRTKVASGYYTGKIFHRVEDWIVQGGAPQCSAGDTRGCDAGGGTQAAEYNDRPFKPGSVGMVAVDKHAVQVNDSQWFVVKKDAPNLLNNYPNFGQVTDGLDVVNKLVGCTQKPNASPGDLDCAAADKINSMTLGTK